MGILNWKKTKYVIPLRVDKNTTDQIIYKWLQQYNFKQKTKGNIQYWGTGMGPGIGYGPAKTCFEYNYEDNNLIIYAYLQNPKMPMPLEQSPVSLEHIAERKIYQDQLKILFDALNTASGTPVNNVDPQQQTNLSSQTPQNSLRNAEAVLNNPDNQHKTLFSEGSSILSTLATMKTVVGIIFFVLVVIATIGIIIFALANR